MEWTCTRRKKWRVEEKAQVENWAVRPNHDQNMELTKLVINTYDIKWWRMQFPEVLDFWTFFDISSGFKLNESETIRYWSLLIPSVYAHSSVRYWTINRMPLLVHHHIQFSRRVVDTVFLVMWKPSFKPLEYLFLQQTSHCTTVLVPGH